MKKNVRLILAFTALLAALASGFSMWQRSQEQLLWGYRPLLLFFGLWLALVLFLQPIGLYKGRPWRWLGLSLGSILLLSVGFPDLVPLPFLLFAGLVPLLIIEREIAASTGFRKGNELWKYTYITLVGWNILTTFWVANTALSAGLVAIILNSALQTIPFMLFHHTRRRMDRLGYVSLAAYWMSFEYFHLNWELTWPWLTLGNGFAEWPSWVQWYEYTGVFGGSLWILTANVLLLRLWDAWREKSTLVAPGLRLGAWILLPLIFSQYLYYSFEEKGRPTEVVVVQPNFEPHYEKFTVPTRTQLARMIGLIEQQISPDTRYVILPESVISTFNLDRPNGNRGVKRLRDHFQDRPGLNLVIGFNGHQIFETYRPEARALRTYVSNRGDTTYFESSNVAAQLTIGKPEIPTYKKSKLVPGPESFPFKEVLWFLTPVVEKVGGTTAGLATQKERAVFASSAGRIGPLICYESVFGEYVTGYVRRGAEALFIMTNDGWWDNTPGHRQHLYFASLRAIETRRSIARAANTGVSAYINQRGDILQRSRYDEQAALRRSMLFREGVTVYVQWGDIIARISAFLAGLLLLNLLVKMITGRDLSQRASAS